MIWIVLLLIGHSQPQEDHLWSWSRVKIICISDPFLFCVMSLCLISVCCSLLSCKCCFCSVLSLLFVIFCYYFPTSSWNTSLNLDSREWIAKRLDKTGLETPVSYLYGWALTRAWLEISWLQFTLEGFWKKMASTKKIADGPIGPSEGLSHQGNPILEWSHCIGFSHPQITDFTRERFHEP